MSMTPCQMIEVIQGYDNGEEIQHLFNADWLSCRDRPLFNFGGCDYRVKPVPKYELYESPVNGNKWVEIKALEDALRLCLLVVGAWETSELALYEELKELIK